MPTEAPFGRWDSPLAASAAAGAKVSLSDLCSDGVALYWLESRPSEGGRTVLVRAGTDGPREHSPPGVSIRSRVHEYGGGAVCLVASDRPGAFAYVDQADQRVWFCDGPAGPGTRPPAVPVALGAPAPPGEVHRHGGLSATVAGDWVLAVREVHREGAPRPVRSVVALSTRAGAGRETTLLEGHDFFGSPRADAGCERLAVVTWDHPDMPWDASTLVVVPLERRAGPAAGGGPVAAGAPWRVAGGATESVGQPSWCRDGSLRFVSDRRGWWEPWWHPGRPGGRATALVDAGRREEWHGPDWVLGQSTLVELDDGVLVGRVTSGGTDGVARLAWGRGTAPGTPERLAQPCVSIAALCAQGGGVAMIGATPSSGADVWSWTPETGALPRRGAPAVARHEAAAPAPRPFTAPGRSGRLVHGTFSPPALDGTRGPDGARPPLVVWCHGGPTGSCQAGLDPARQFFTSRGFAVACVDYAGSTGYGRAYRCALWGQWGVADAEDCVDAARYLAAAGLVDPDRVAVRGASAGGLTALNTLAAGEGVRACVSWYGVTDLLGLVASTHDFEAHYTDRLVGPLPAARALYEERSPDRRAGEMHGAVLLLQGTEDAVVPPSQAERMRDALVAAGVPCQLLLFEGEGHGFRRADTLEACLEAELAFYRECLGL